MHPGGGQVLPLTVGELESLSLSTNVKPQSAITVESPEPAMLPFVFGKGRPEVFSGLMFPLAILSLPRVKDIYGAVPSVLRLEDLLQSETLNTVEDWSKSSQRDPLSRNS